MIEGLACRTRASLFTEFARALGFPEYFGNNWDAFTDCLRDSGPATVYIAHASALLAEEPRAQLQILVDVLSDAELEVVLGATPGEAAILKDTAWYSDDA